MMVMAILLTVAVAEAHWRNVGRLTTEWTACDDSLLFCTWDGYWEIAMILMIVTKGWE